MTTSKSFSILSILTLSALGTAVSHAGAAPVPDGGSMALLLGVALLGLAGLRSFLGRK